MIQVTGPGAVILIQDGSSGFYQFTTDGTAGTYTVTVILPPGYEWSQSCLAQGTLDPTGQPNPYVLGSGENSATGFLTSNQCTAFYLQFDLAQGDPLILNNNLPLAQSASSIPTLSEWGMIILAMLLGAVAILVLRQRKTGAIGL